MNYDEAMAAIYRKGTKVVGRAGMRIGWRFGRPVVLTEAERFIDFTPTAEDMRATDWELVDG